MPRRRTFNRNGSLLDAPAGVDPTSWANDNLLTKAKPMPAPEACRCPPADPKGNRFGGCRPGLRWASHGELIPVCLLCQRQLVRGINRRREQLWAMGLAELFNRDEGSVDLTSISDLFAPGDDRPEPEPLDSAMGWPMPAPRPRGPIVPDAQAHADAVAALERDEAALAATAAAAAEGA